MIDPLSVHICTIQRSRIDYGKRPIHATEHRMGAGNRGIVQQNIGMRVTANGHFIFVKQIPGSGYGPSCRNQQRRIVGQPCNGVQVLRSQRTITGCGRSYRNGDGRHANNRGFACAWNRFSHTRYSTVFA